jgi:hypothetical protein
MTIHWQVDHSVMIEHRLMYSQDESTPILIGQQHIELRDQLRDYQFRGEELARMNFYCFMVDTYEEPVTSAKMDTCHDDSHYEATTKSGRPRNIRSQYLAAANKPNKRRVQRTSGHENLPRFIGRWFPSAKDGSKELYGASILLLLKPWRALSDLKDSEESFEVALTDFMSTATTKEKDMVENIQYHHLCWEVAQKRRDALKKGKVVRLFDYERDRDAHMSDEEDIDLERPGSDDEEERSAQPTLAVNEAMIDAERLKQREGRDRIFARQAMTLAHAANIFDDIPFESRRLPPFPRRATYDDMQVIDSWTTRLQEMTRRQNEEEGDTNVTKLHLYSSAARETRPSIQLDNAAEGGSHGVYDATDYSSSGEPRNKIRHKLAILNDDQRRAHEIIERRIFGSKRKHPYP